MFRICSFSIGCFVNSIQDRFLVIEKCLTKSTFLNASTIVCLSANEMALIIKAKIKELDNIKWQRKYNKPKKSFGCIRVWHSISKLLFNYQKCSFVLIKPNLNRFLVWKVLLTQHLECWNQIFFRAFDSKIELQLFSNFDLISQKNSLFKVHLYYFDLSDHQLWNYNQYTFHNASTYADPHDYTDGVCAWSPKNRPRLRS